MLVPSLVNVVPQCRIPGLATASPGDAPGSCGCANTGTPSTNLAWSALTGKPDSHMPQLHFCPSERCWSILQEHIQRSFWECCPSPCKQASYKPAPPSTRQAHPSGYWSRDKLNSLQPFSLPKPLTLQNNSRYTLHRSVSYIFPRPANSKKFKFCTVHYKRHHF